MSSAGRIWDQLSGVEFPIESGRNLSINLRPYSELGTIDSLDEDLVRVAAYVYAADLAIKRHEREQHLRSVRVRIPVVNLQAFERVHSLLEQALTTVSIDNWTIEFVPRTAGAPASNRTWPDKRDATLMFSGGLDSFAGAIKLCEQNDAVSLVSHVTHNRPVRTAQSTLAKALASNTTKRLTHLQVSVYGRNHGGLTFPSDDEREDTQRTRSFLFTALAAIAARLSGSRRVVVMAENGQFAIHLPLSAARVGSFSTHTAHPKFLALMQAVLRQLYVCEDLDVVNPFVHLTKGEIVAMVPEPLRQHIRHSTSCWRAARVPTEQTHCGECVPCLCRRIALETNKIKIPEYHRDLLSENVGSLDADDLGKRNLVDLCQFIALFDGKNRLKEELDVCYAFPELFDQQLNAPEIISMYRRFAKESFAVLKGYKHVRALLK